MATARAAITRDRAAQAALAQGGLMILSSLDEMLSAAARQQKLTFVLMGRSTCGNYNATREGIRGGKIMVTGPLQPGRYRRGQPDDERRG